MPIRDGLDRLRLTALGLSIAIVAANFVIGATAPITVFPYDHFMFLDGIWRIVEGQRDGADFYNPMGFGLFHVGAWLWRIVGARNFVVALTSAVFATIIVVCGAVVAVRRLHGSPAACLSICAILALIASAPTAYGWSVFAVSLSGFYNRLSVAAIGVLVLQCFAASRQRDRRLSEAVITAILLTVLLSTKISALGLGILAIAAGLLSERGAATDARTWRHLIAVALLFVAMAAIVCVAMDVRPDQLIREYREAAHARGVLATGDAATRIARSWGALVAAILLAVAGISQLRAGVIDLWRFLALMATFIVIQLALNITNTQPATFFIAPFCAAVLLAFAAAQETGWRATAGKNILLLAVGALVLVPQVLSSLVGAGLAVASAAGIVHPVIVTGGGGRLAVPVMNFVDDQAPAVGYARAVDDGLTAIEALGVGREKIASLDYADPFPVMLGAPPPVGVPVVWAIGYMEPIDRVPDPRALFGDACIVMAPVTPVKIIEGSTDFVAAAAAPWLAKSFVLVRADADWKIYRRSSCTPRAATATPPASPGR